MPQERSVGFWDGTVPVRFRRLSQVSRLIRHGTSADASATVSGFRLDAAPRLIKREGTTSVGLPETHVVIKRLRSRLEKNHPEVIFLAEAHQTPSLTKSYFGDGDECHMAYNFPLMEQLWLAFVMKEKFGKVWNGEDWDFVKV